MNASIAKIQTLLHTGGFERAADRLGVLFLLVLGVSTAAAIGVGL